MDKHGPERPSSTVCYGNEWVIKTHQDPRVQFVTDKNGLDYSQQDLGDDLLQIRVCQKDPPRPMSTICDG